VSLVRIGQPFELIELVSVVLSVAVQVVELLESLVSEEEHPPKCVVIPKPPDNKTKQEIKIDDCFFKRKPPSKKRALLRILHTYY
jgi:hypothetical protein